MSQKPETALTKKIKDSVAKEYPGSFLFKVHGSAFQMAGIPDLVGSIEGRFVALEVKVPGNKLTDLQAATLDRLRKAGALAAKVESPKEALTILEEGLR